MKDGLVRRVEAWDVSTLRTADSRAEFGGGTVPVVIGRAGGRERLVEFFKSSTE